MWGNEISNLFSIAFSYVYNFGSLPLSLLFQRV